MKESNYFGRILDIVSWEKLQSSISEATGMAIITVDYRGIPVTSHSGCCEFCKRVRNDEKLGKYCQKCDALGGLEGVITQKPYIYRCHFSIVDIAIPIIVDGNYLGAVMAGQVHLQNAEDMMPPEQILSVDDTVLQSARDNLKECYEQIPTFTSEQLDHTANMLFYLCDFLAKGNLNRDKSVASEKKLFIEEKQLSLPIVSNRIIGKAVDFIYTRKSQAISLTEVALHCNVSAPYLSRLFTKELGETYSAFVTRLKIAWAKEILQSTDMTVLEVSYQLGFNEPGYFIKTFKKYTNETPMSYRSNWKKEKGWNWYIKSNDLNEKISNIL